MLRTKKFIFSITAIAIITVTLTVTLVALSFSWFTDLSESETVITVQADGVINIYIPFSTTYIPSHITPAVAMPYAVANGEYMDVLTEYDPLSQNPSYVSKAASIVTATDRFVLYNESARRVQAVDEGGNPIFDEYGEPVYEIEVDENGDPVYDENGDPIYVTTYVCLINYHISAVSSGSTTPDYIYNMDEFVLQEFYFSFNETPIPLGFAISPENGAIAFNSQSADKRTGSITIIGSQEVYIHFRVYLKNVDELMDPMLKEKMIFFAITLDAS